MKFSSLSRTTLAKGMTLIVILFAMLVINFYRGETDFSSLFLSTNPNISTETWAAITSLQDKLLKNPDDTATYFSLAGQYLQGLRENADTTLYDRVEMLMRAVEKKEPANPDIVHFRTQILLGKHLFADALENAARLVKDYPTNRAYGVTLADTYVELGRYDEAVQKLQELLDAKPEASIYSRVAYLREIFGDREGAIEMMEFALNSGGRVAENIAWSYAELGRLWAASNTERAEQSYDRSLEVYGAAFAPALDGMGKIAAYEGQLDEAVKYLDQALVATPLPGYAATLGDLYLLQGDEKKAAAYYKVVEVGFEKLKAAGTNVDFDFAQFLVRHTLQTEYALSLAQSVYETRKTIYAADLIAWGLYHQKKYTEAEAFIKEALRTNTDNGEILYHAGKITEALGKKAEARSFIQKALADKLHFSLLDIEDARETLQLLEK